jgi:hypothetical protein
VRSSQSRELSARITPRRLTRTTRVQGSVGREGARRVPHAAHPWLQGPVRHQAVLVRTEVSLPSLLSDPRCLHHTLLTLSTASNPTYVVKDLNGSRYVVRKKPAGALVSQTAHAVEREFRIIQAVGKTGKVPVPKVYALCTDTTLLGTPFYVMEYLEGRIFTDVRMPEIKSREERFLA